MKIKVDEIIFREDLYPRIKKDPITVQKYAETIDILPPIEINQRNELIDGWHRWTAYKKKEIEEILVTITETQSDIELLELAIERNSKYGLQLSQEDKKDKARQIYHVTPERERDEKKKHLAKILSVSERTIRDWLSRIDKDAKAARNKRIFNLWMACYTQEEIAEREEIHKDTVSEICRKMAELPESDKPSADHLIDFEVPLYNIWKYKETTGKLKHFGNTEQTIVDNLLYLYTNVFNIVVDPFAGSGSTVDVCKKRYRRYWVSDRKVEPEYEDDIRVWDIVNGLPKISRWKEVKLIYLDPPYWKQSEGKYSQDANDLANMSLDIFHTTLSHLIKSFAKKLHPQSYIALIIQPTQWKAPNKEFTDHITALLQSINLKINMRIQCPYESQQCTASMVDWAKENKRLLVISRELIVWET